VLGALIALALALEPTPELPPLEVLARDRRADGGGARALLGDPGRILATHPSELLARMPGVWLSRGSGQESLLAIRSPVLTGLGACGAFLILEDGVPIRPVGFCNVNQIAEAALELAGSIEVLRGPGSVAHGGHALHGVIALSPPPLTPSSRLAAESGSFARRGLRAGVGGAGSRLDLLAVASESFREAEGFGQQKLWLQWLPEGDPGGWRLSLAASRLRQDTAGFVSGEGAWRDRRRFLNPNPEAFRDAEGWRLALHRLAGGWRTILYLRRDEHRFLQHFILAQPRETVGSASAGLRLSGDAGPFHLGLDLEAARGWVLERQERPLESGPALQRLIRPAGRHYDFRVGALYGGLFGRFHAELGGGAALGLGLRVEGLRYDYDNRMAPGNLREDGTPCPAPGGCLFQRPDDRRDLFSGGTAETELLLPLAGERSRLRLRLVHASRMPLANELYRLQRGQEVAELAPEKIAGLEAGWRREERDAFLALEGFAYRKRDLVLRDAEGFLRTGGRTDHAGLEIEFGRALAEGTRLSGHLSFGRHRYRFDSVLAFGERIERGRRIDSAPVATGFLELVHAFGGEGRIALSLRHLGPYPLDAENRHRYPGHRLLDLELQRELPGGWRLQGRIANLLDRRYAERADVAFGELRAIPGAGRTWLLRLERRVGG
jgi:outer membrane receptor protein involved in Fe transport